ncbi:transcription factor LHW-like [Arachis stenosperma]|uniref:transcription factor LHW-like n=1 Tax=Arachis stenosperma TaxID=217475 RepID=UPI0025ABD874|nr:transcription factor LHW-like [Arachis stenosperma]
MGFLLKEALKTLCARHQWSYAVFWKIGCNNSKLLIWEDCYYEPLPSPFPASVAGEGSWFSSESQLSQLGIQDEDRVCSLINKMMVNNSVNIAGEGIIGRAAFTGNYQWILLNNFTRNAYPPEVYTEVHHQFSAGIQTIVVIPVLPHGVVQLGSFLPIMENIGFVNDVKSLILQLGFVPGALLSDDYSAKLSTISLAKPANVGIPVSVDPPVITPNCPPLIAGGSNQASNSSHVPKYIVQHINNYHGSIVTPQSCNINQISSKYHNEPCKPNDHSITKTNVSGQQESMVVKAEAELMPSNFSSCMQKQSGSYNTRSAYNDLASFRQPSLGDCSLKYMEQQILSGVGRQSHVSPNMNTSSTLNMAQLKTNSSRILGCVQSSPNSSVLGGVPTSGGMTNLMRTDMINGSASSLPQNVGMQSVSNLTNQSITTHMPSEDSDQKNHTVDLKRAYDALASLDQGLDDVMLQDFKIPSLHLEEHVSMNDHISGFVGDCLIKDATSQHMMGNAKHEEACTQPPSSDDLFDVLGADFKMKLLNGNWNKLLADEPDAGAENLDNKPTYMNMHGAPHYSRSISETISSSGIISATCTDNLLDAVISRAQSASAGKQNSDDMSCRTTVTRTSTSSTPSPACKQVLFDVPKTGDKIGSAETSSAKNTSIYGSQLSSWIENGSSVKCENSVSTGYSKKPDEGKSNRKRLKPGENPRPRPKDRQMIQDRVKELREIVPNGAKCSIDSLLERTIKHMLFLQSVTKHADKLKQTGESKIISKEGGLLLRDNFEGGATWAYEVGSQSMVCPIIVEDLSPPRQMLVEMLCEERGFFLEIADLIRGLGLTILKGVMETRNDKIWARFAVEANRDVTRMEIFMSLVRLLEQTVKGNASSSNAVDNMMAYHSFPQATQIPATGMPTSLQ